MEPVKPVIIGHDNDRREVNYAEDQPEYRTLPTLKTKDGQVISRWELSDEELETIKTTKSIYLINHTFNQPLQPILMTVDKADVVAILLEDDAVEIKTEQ